MSNTDASYLRELIESATSPDDLQAATALLEEAEQKSSVGAQTKWTVSTLKEVADFFGVHPTTVKGWRMETPPMPGEAGNKKGESGSWPLNEIAKWRIAKISKSAATERKKQIELERAETAAEMERMELAEKKGELVERAEVERWAASAMVEFRTMALALPGLLVSSVPPEVREVTRAESDRQCREMLIMLKRRLETNALLPDSDSAAGTAADS